jgi:DnaK suppressor protein
MATKKKTNEEVEVFDIDSIDEDAELTRADLERLRASLGTKRSEVAANIQKHISAVTEDSDNLPDEMDIATRQSEQAYFLRIAEKEKKLLQQIDHALAKFERGTYGVGDGTDAAMGQTRLYLRPWTRYGLEYKEQIEREKGGRAKRR